MIFTIAHTNPKIFSPAHTNPREFGIANVNPRLVSVTHQNPSQFKSTRLQLAENLYVNSVVLPGLIFPSLEAIDCKLSVYNSGLSGNGIITWQVINQAGYVVRSDTQWSGIIVRHTSSLVTITGLLTLFNQTFRIRARANEFAAWTVSELLQSYPAGITCVTVSPSNDIYWPGNQVICSIKIANTGAKASFVAEWQVVNWSDNSVISSGVNGSDIIAGYSTAVVYLSGITAPIAPNTTARIRARIQGSSTWTNATMQLLNYIPAPPANPTPRGPDDPPPPPEG